MNELIKKWFELIVKQNWLKTIDREVDKYNKLKRKMDIQNHVVHKLVERYNELYPNDMIDTKDIKF